MKPLTQEELRAHDLLPHQVNHARKVLRRMYLKIGQSAVVKLTLSRFDGVVGWLLACRLNPTQAQLLADSFLGRKLPAGLDPELWGKKVEKEKR